MERTAAATSAGEPRGRTYCVSMEPCRQMREPNAAFNGPGSMPLAATWMGSRMSTPKAMMRSISGTMAPQEWNITFTPWPCAMSISRERRGAK